MNILITDACGSADRGDAAILDGIVSGLRRRLPAVQITVTTRFPELAQRVHAVAAIDDRDALAVVRAIDAADLVVGCGGLHDRDLDLHPRLATIHACARAGTPFVAFGQSIGPLDSPLARTAARNALSEATWIAVRDEASARIVRHLGVAAPLKVGVDAAVGGRVTPQVRGTRAPLLGVTVRGWHFPGSPDPAAAQDRYERAVAVACDAWCAHTDGRVRFLSTCTPLGGCTQDDRIAARRVVARMAWHAEVIEADDLPFDVVRGQAGNCDALLGTRLHSLIFATTAGVPSVGIATELETGEWLEQVGLGGRWRPIEDPEGITPMLIEVWDGRFALRRAIQERLPGLLARAEAQLDTLADIAQGLRPAVGRPARPSPGQPARAVDQQHRRLRAVADAVLAEAPGGRVLDLGPSSGLLGRMLGPRFDYTGIDGAPSAACDEPGFRVRPGAIDGEWSGAFDVVVASGSLESVADLPATLARIRGALRPGGLAVFTLFNLAHASRGVGARRHPDWRFTARPDELILHLREIGLGPARISASSAGPLPLAGGLDLGGALPLPRLLRLAHHVVAVCRPTAPRPGPSALAALRASPLEALPLALEIAKEAPWSARAWADLGALSRRAGDLEQARRCLLRARVLDPERPGLEAELRAVA